MAIPGMDLQAQYEQTLQNTIGKSQRDRLQDVRKQQTLANTDWSLRGVGQGAQRMAGFQEVNPSSMPNMSDETRSFIKPLLGTYQEGGRDVEGYYGKDNPYTQGGLESILTGQGYARAPASLEEQFKYAGLKLPNAYGQNYYNAQHEAVGNEIAKYQQQQYLLQQQQDPARLYEENFKKLYSQLDPTKYRVKDEATTRGYYDRGFIPGQDNGDWKWSPGAPIGVDPLGIFSGNMVKPEEDPNYLEQMQLYNYGIRLDKPEPRQLTQDEQFANDMTTGLKELFPEGSGSWYNKKYDADVRYTPKSGYYTADDLDKLSGSFHKYMPALTMAALGAMTGGAGTLIGGGAGTVGGALAGGVGSAIPTTMHTGLTTGDWGKALEQGGISALAGGLSGAYGGDLSNALGMSGKLGESIAKGAISGAVNTAGNALLGNKIDPKNILANTLSNIAAPYLGDLTKNAIGGAGGDIFGGAVGGFSGSALKNILQGKSLDIGTAINTLSGATGGLGNLFSNSNEDKQSVYGPTSLAKTLEGTKNASTKNWRT